LTALFLQYFCIVGILPQGHNNYAVLPFFGEKRLL
jgi:hypothetical protein